MSSLSDIMSASSQALRIQQLAMQIIGQNTANANTDGYSRERIDFSTSPPYAGMGLWDVGSGVDIGKLGRVRDQLLDDQIRRNATTFGYWQQRDDNLSRVEEVFNELSGSAISDQLSSFWAAWQDLANHPESAAGRQAVVQNAQSLASSVRDVYAQLTDRRNTLDRQVTSAVDEVNALTQQIATLNLQIVHGETGGQEASRLRDQRDLAVDRLSHLINITTQESSDGAVNVYNGGQMLVQLGSAQQLTLSTADQNGAVTVISYGLHGPRAQLEGGEIKSLLDVRDNDITAVMSKLDEFAKSLAERVNEVHRTGYGLSGTSGQDFFASDVTGAANFRVSAAILQDPSRVAAAGAPDAPGDNSIALRLAAIQNDKTMNNGTSTLGDFYKDIVLDVGSRKANAANELKVETAVMDNLENRRQQISGVSVDEEMSRMVQVQQAYAAAAKVVNTVDQMMQTVLAIGTAA
jgi:flagellar hook-associated protein 1